MLWPTAWGRGQLEWDSGQLAQRVPQAEAGDSRFSSSLLARRYLLSCSDLCTLRAATSKHSLLAVEVAAFKDVKLG